jgi:hypothetical protein
MNFHQPEHFMSSGYFTNSEETFRSLYRCGCLMENESPPDRVAPSDLVAFLAQLGDGDRR